MSSVFLFDAKKPLKSRFSFTPWNSLCDSDAQQKVYALLIVGLQKTLYMNRVAELPVPLEIP